MTPLRERRRHACIKALIAETMACQANKLPSIYTKHSDGTTHLSPAYGGPKVS